MARSKSFLAVFTKNFGKNVDKTHLQLPWIPEPSVNNKLKCREGSGSTG
jgi:hypothetical protein